MSGPVAAYVHVPFCASRCPYCDYGVTLGALDLAGVLVETIAAEAADALRAAPRLALSIAYIGGGTPSRLPAALIERLVGALRQRCTAAAELTLEVNPEDLDATLRSVCRSAGVSRLSLGAQATQGALLHRIGRATGAPEVRRSLHQLDSWAGRSNVDLLAGIPGQSTQDLRDSIAAAGDASDHVTLLQLEPLLAAAETSAAAGELAAELWLQGRDALLGAGFDQYETVHFGRGGQRSEYVLHTARLEPIVALGPHAAGVVPAALLGRGAAVQCASQTSAGAAYRTAHGDSLVAYVAAAATGFGVAAGPIDAADFLLDCLIGGLRLAAGIERVVWQRRFGSGATAWLDELVRRWEQQGLARSSDRHWQLTPAGALIADRLVAAANEQLDQLREPGGLAAHWP